MPVPEHSVHYLEIVTPDATAARDLCVKAYGWQFRTIPALGNAFVAELPGGSLCGIRAPMGTEEQPIVRPYLRVNDLTKAVQDAAQSGAKILLERMELPGHGVIAIFEHGGVQQGLWQIP